MNYKHFIKIFRYFLESLTVRFGLWFFYILGWKKASDTASFLACKIGRLHKVNILAMKNLSRAFPNFTKKQKKEILENMWDNLGRVVGEYVHIAKISKENLVKQYVITSEETLQNIDFLKKNKLGGIIFSGHIGNWEIGPKCFSHYGIKAHTVYRPLNNIFVENITAKMRGESLINKGGGNRKIIEAIKNGEYVIILADQKISDGERVKFFNDDAYTTTSIARIALKYGVPLIPARSIRIKNRFRVEVEKPLEFKKTNDLNADIFNITRLINQTLEKWITEYPSQWFFVHNRWKE
jgi:KDO2-lipid IV(A) lauroyltransferase